MPTSIFLNGDNDDMFSLRHINSQINTLLHQNIVNHMHKILLNENLALTCKTI